MDNKFSIGSIIALVFVLNLVFGIFEGEQTFSISTFIGIFAGFAVLANILSAKKKKQQRENNGSTVNKSNSHWSSLNVDNNRVSSKHECEYCGHMNDTSKEYCENCGAKQLPQ